MLRNKEIRVQIVVLLLISLAGTGICFALRAAAGIVCLCACGALTAVTLLDTSRRYRDIARLSDYLKRIVNGDYALDLRDNTEGELSILKNEIYKVTSRLSEQASLLEKDKRFLADSLSDISHQLKTPLTSMLVMTDLLEDETLPREKREEFTRNIHNQLERMQWLVSSLLKLSRLDAGTVAFRKEPCDPSALVRRAIQPLQIPMELKNQALTVTGEGGSPVNADANWTVEALVNILKNCVEHTEENGEIRVELEGNALYTQIRISDSGEGISKEDLPHIFQRFYKGKNAGGDSVGIGLAMSHTIISSQGGSLTAESRTGHGTRFTIRLYKSEL